MVGASSPTGDDRGWDVVFPFSTVCCAQELWFALPWPPDHLDRQLLGRGQNRAQDRALT